MWQTLAIDHKYEMNMEDFEIRGRFISESPNYMLVPDSTIILIFPYNNMEPFKYILIEQFKAYPRFLIPYLMDNIYYEKLEENMSGHESVDKNTEKWQTLIVDNTYEINTLTLKIRRKISHKYPSLLMYTTGWGMKLNSTVHTYRDILESQINGHPEILIHLGMMKVVNNINSQLMDFLFPGDPERYYFNVLHQEQ
jgi:hypothetical protein